MFAKILLHQIITLFIYLALSPMFCAKKRRGSGNSAQSESRTDVTSSEVTTTTNTCQSPLNLGNLEMKRGKEQKREKMQKSRQPKSKKPAEKSLKKSEKPMNFSKNPNQRLGYSRSLIAMQEAQLSAIFEKGSDSGRQIKDRTVEPEMMTLEKTQTDAANRDGPI